jgi:hypothetical protein
MEHGDFKLYDAQAINRWPRCGRRLSRRRRDRRGAFD